MRINRAIEIKNEITAKARRLFRRLEKRTRKARTKFAVSFYTIMACAGIVLIGSEAGDWPSQIFVSTGGMVMFLVGIYFATETLREG